MNGMPTQQDTERHLHFMRLALSEAEAALADRHFPCGCVLVEHDTVIAIGRNRVYAEQDATRHAEMVALANAYALRRDTVLLEGVTAYVTVEPCLMCAGALLQAGVSRVLFAAESFDNGPMSTRHILSGTVHANAIAWVPGVLRDESARLLQQWSHLKHQWLARWMQSDESGRARLLETERLSAAHLEAWACEARNAQAPVDP